MRVSRKQVVYDTQHVRRTVVYTARYIKNLSMAKIKSFYMNLMFDNSLINKLKHSVGVEGEGA